MSEVFDTHHIQSLGGRAPQDLKHLAKFPLAPFIAGLTKPVPVAIGINWYTNFDRPVYKNGHWWIGLSDNLGSIRGRHCVCLKPDSMTDLEQWWVFYDQGREGACEGFGSARMMTLLNRAKYDAFWLYHEAQKIDGWPLPHEGTSGRAALEILRTLGLKTPAGAEAKQVQGIAAYRWAQSLSEVEVCLRSPNHRIVGGVPLLNSWGRFGYPHVTYVPHDLLDELLFRQDGEAAVITDR